MLCTLWQNDHDDEDQMTHDNTNVNSNNAPTTTTQTPTTTTIPSTLRNINHKSNPMRSVRFESKYPYHILQGKSAHLFEDFISKTALAPFETLMSSKDAVWIPIFTAFNKVDDSHVSIDGNVHQVHCLREDPVEPVGRQDVVDCVPFIKELEAKVSNHRVTGIVVIRQPIGAIEQATHRDGFENKGLVVVCPLTIDYTIALFHQCEDKADEELIDEESKEIVKVPVNSALVFNLRTPHRGTANNSSRVRYVLHAHLDDDDFKRKMGYTNPVLMRVNGVPKSYQLEHVEQDIEMRTTKSIALQNPPTAQDALSTQQVDELVEELKHDTADIMVCCI